MPIGFGIILFNEISPVELWGGNWLLIEEGYALWTSKPKKDNNGIVVENVAGQTIQAGLPNILGQIGNNDACPTFMNSGYSVSTSGVFDVGYKSRLGYREGDGQGWILRGEINFDASKSNEIYGNSTIVQPPAIKIYLWKRVE